MDFIHKEGTIYAEDSNGTVIAEVTFPAESEHIIRIDHTFVDNSLRGQGVAGKLIEQVVDYATKSNKKIKPVCSYAVQWFKMHPESASLLA